MKQKKWLLSITFCLAMFIGMQASALAKEETDNIYNEMSIGGVGFDTSWDMVKTLYGMPNKSHSMKVKLKNGGVGKLICMLYVKNKDEMIGINFLENDKQGYHLGFVVSTNKDAYTPSNFKIGDSIEKVREKFPDGEWKEMANSKAYELSVVKNGVKYSVQFVVDKDLMINGMMLNTDEIVANK